MFALEARHEAFEVARSRRRVEDQLVTEPVVGGGRRAHHPVAVATLELAAPTRNRDLGAQRERAQRADSVRHRAEIAARDHTHNRLEVIASELAASAEREAFVGYHASA